MSSSIWTRCAGDSDPGHALRPFAADAIRVVESQHQVSTRRLVDSLEAQDVLETLLERAKPAPRAGPTLHYLLTTPFRYPPLRHGSRFATRHEPSLWYGSDTVQTAFAEVAYYRLVFLEGTRADLGTLATPLTSFTARIRTRSGLDLTVPPFAHYRRQIASRTRYRATQALGAAMREAGVEAFRYPSARDRDHGTNLAAFTPRVFGRRQPTQLAEWHSTATRDRVEVWRRDYFTTERYAFPRRDFLVGGSLPWPAP